MQKENTLFQAIPNCGSHADQTGMNLKITLSRSLKTLSCNAAGRAAAAAWTDIVRNAKAAARPRLRLHLARLIH
ncbi:MAG: hypothetical protein ABWY14_20185 [Tardiphaga sp.]